MISAVVAGNLGKDATVRDAGGQPVCSFSVASTKKDRGGEKHTTWVSCSLWGKRGTALVSYLTKGSRVVVSGELSTRVHDGKTYLELRVNEVELMGGGQRGASADAGKPQAVGGGYSDDDYGAAADGDLPF